MKRRVFMVFKISTILLFLTVYTSSLAGSLVSSETESSIKSGAGAVVPAQDGMQRFASEGNLQLYANSSNGEFEIRDVNTESVWKSNPDDKKQTSSFKGIARFTMFSQILLNIYDVKAQDEIRANSYTNSVNLDGFRMKSLKNGVELVYYFEDYKIEVPVDIRLVDNSLSVSVNTASIKNNKDYFVKSISLAPVFGSGSQNDEGYILFPDGSGSIAYFNNKKIHADRYKKRLYGQDFTFSTDIYQNTEHPAMLPVYGIKNGDKAFLAVISKGAETATVEGYTAGMYNTQNTAYATFNIYNSDIVTIGTDSKGSVKDVYKINTKKPASDSYEVRYYFLNGNNADYSGMAKKYNDILKNDGAGKSYSDQFTLYTDFNCGITKTESVFGIPLNTFKTLTSYSDVRKAYEKLLESGITDLGISISNWNNQEISGRLQSVPSAYSKLGGNNELKNLEDTLTKNNTPLWLSYNPLLLQKSGGGFSVSFDSVKKISGLKAETYKYKRSTYLKDSEITPFKFPKLTKLGGYLNKYFNAFNRKFGKAGISSAQLGSILYTDYSKDKETSRGEMVSLLGGNMSKQNNSFMLKTPNAYALPYTEVAFAIPDSSDGSGMTDLDIPFYQMALSGLVKYTTPSVNLNENPNRTVLKALETGSNLYYEWVYENASLLLNTRWSYLYGSDFNSWVNKASGSYKTLKSAFENIGTMVMTGHEQIADNVYKTTYANGNYVIVNYNDVPYTFNNNLIDSNSFIVNGGGTFR